LCLVFHPSIFLFAKDPFFSWMGFFIAKSCLKMGFWQSRLSILLSSVCILNAHLYLNDIEAIFTISVYRTGQPNWEFNTVWKCGNSAFFCHSDFAWNQFGSISEGQKLKFEQFWRLWILIFGKISHLEMSKVTKNHNSEVNSQMVKIAVFGGLND